VIIASLKLRISKNLIRKGASSIHVNRSQTISQLYSFIYNFIVYFIDKFIYKYVTIRKKKRIRIGFIKNLVPGIQPILKVDGVKYFITGVKIGIRNRLYGGGYLIIKLLPPFIVIKLFSSIRT
jgi:nucleoside recognition membrane protein YjiH